MLFLINLAKRFAYRLKILSYETAAASLQTRSDNLLVLSRAATDQKRDGHFSLFHAYKVQA